MSQCRRLLHGARPGRAAVRAAGVPASAVPPRLPVRQRRCGHSRAEGPDRQAYRRHQFSAGRKPLGARRPGGTLRRAAQIDHLGGRSRGGYPFNKPDDLKIEMIPRGKRLDVCWRKARSGDAVARIPGGFCKATNGSSGCFRTISRSRSIISQDRHLPDHARYGDQAGDRREVSLGADQPGEGLRQGEGDGVPAHRQSARRAAGLGAHGGGGAGGNPGARSVGLWPRRAEPQDAGDDPALCAQAGADQPGLHARRTVRADRSRRCRRRRGNLMDRADVIAAIRRRMADEGLERIVAVHDGTHFIETPNPVTVLVRFQVARAGGSHLDKAQLQLDRDPAMGCRPCA